VVDPASQKIDDLQSLVYVSTSLDRRGGGAQGRCGRR
jgi:hypothetical protein